jgi:hypothetical protein
MRHRYIVHYLVLFKMLLFHIYAQTINIQNELDRENRNK